MRCGGRRTWRSRERTPEQRRYLAQSVAQFWDAADRIFALAREGKTKKRARRSGCRSRRGRRRSARPWRGCSSRTTRARSRRRERVQAIYEPGRAAGVLVPRSPRSSRSSITSAYLIRSNRRLFAELALVSNERRELAQNLIAAQESTLRQISRELHDEFGQVLTAIGSMLRRAGRHVAEDSPLHGELREVGEIAQTTLDNVRSLSQTLHPSILEELGLESTVEWYLSTVERQLGITVSYERTGTRDAR